MLFTLLMLKSEIFSLEKSEFRSFKIGSIEPAWH